jgi:hypothetical protein
VYGDTALKKKSDWDAAKKAYSARFAELRIMKRADDATEPDHSDGRYILVIPTTEKPPIETRSVEEANASIDAYIAIAAGRLDATPASPRLLTIVDSPYYDEEELNALFNITGLHTSMDLATFLFDNEDKSFLVIDQNTSRKVLDKFPSLIAVARNFIDNDTLPADEATSPTSPPQTHAQANTAPPHVTPEARAPTAPSSNNTVDLTTTTTHVPDRNEPISARELLAVVANANSTASAGKLPENVRRFMTCCLRFIDPSALHACGLDQLVTSQNQGYHLLLTQSHSRITAVYDKSRLTPQIVENLLLLKFTSIFETQSSVSTFAKAVIGHDSCDCAYVFSLLVEITRIFLDGPTYALLKQLDAQMTHMLNKDPNLRPLAPKLIHWCCGQLERRFVLPDSFPSAAALSTTVTIVGGALGAITFVPMTLLDPSPMRSALDKYIVDLRLEARVDANDDSTSTRDRTIKGRNKGQNPTSGDSGGKPIGNGHDNTPYLRELETYCLSSMDGRPCTFNRRGEECPRSHEFLPQHLHKYVRSYCNQRNGVKGPIPTRYGTSAGRGGGGRGRGGGRQIGDGDRGGGRGSGRGRGSDN